MENLQPIEYWTYTPLANKTAMDAQDNRARTESNRIQSGENMEKVHSEALRDYADIRRVLLGGFAFLKHMRLDFSGAAADLGSGIGTGATILSQLPEINRVYAVEFSEQLVLHLMPRVFEEYQAETSKIVPVVGDFNHLHLDNESLAVILEVDSFHHSEDLDVTLRECHRVLKTGGVIVATDRAWPDSTPRDELEKKLDKEYTAAQKTLWGIPADQVYRRRDSGEHEYTIRDWQAAFNRNGFDAHVFTQVHPPGLNRILTKLPTFAASTLLASLTAQIGSKRHLIYGFGATRKLFVCIKR